MRRLTKPTSADWPEMLKGMAVDTQFVMVTHSKRMMTAADMIYGVTMQEPGVSKIVSVRMGGATERVPARAPDRRSEQTTEHMAMA